MGMIRIKLSGSFRRTTELFGAQQHGHARAVADAMRWLAEDVLPTAIQQDHKLHEQGHTPDRAFGKD